jgi:hypothetical protein
MKVSRLSIAISIMAAIAVSGWGQLAPPANARPAPLSHDAHMKALGTATSLEPAARDVALKNLVKTAPEGLATEAMMQLIRLRTADIETLALDLVSTFADVNVRNLLAVAGRTRDAHLKMALARATLERADDRTTQISSQRYEIGGQGTDGFAAMMLSESSQPADRNLVARVVRKSPHDSGLWLALAKMGVTSSEELSLAYSVMRDTEAPRWARLASAAVLSPHSADAKAFLTTALTSFLTTFGQKDFDTIMAEFRNVRPDTPQDPQSTAHANFQPGMLMIGILEFVQIPDAERLTFEFLDANNPLVRGALGLVAAKRWPDRLLGTALSHDDERLKLLAALSVLHPEFLPRVRALVSGEQLENLRTKVTNNGVEILFTMPGNAGLVF